MGTGRCQVVVEFLVDKLQSVFLILIGYVDRDHRSAPVKGEMHGFAALDRCLIDDLSAGTPIRTQPAARQRHTTRRGVTLRLTCILYALPSDTRSRIRIRKRRSRLRQHRIAAPALTDTSGTDTIPRKMQSI